MVSKLRLIYSVALAGSGKLNWLWEWWGEYQMPSLLQSDKTKRFRVAWNPSHLGWDLGSHCSLFVWTPFYPLSVGSGRGSSFIQGQGATEIHHLLAAFGIPDRRVSEPGCADNQLLSHRSTQKTTLLMYWPLDDYLDLLECDLLAKEMLLLKQTGE